MSKPDDEDLSEKMSELYIAECNAVKARLEVETECRRIIADNYEKVLEQAREYSKKLEVPINAKVCEVGWFCDAHLVRTNQLTMEMGAQYYVECNIFTAEKIVARRVSEMRKTRDDGLESIRMVEEKVKFCQENFSNVKIDGGPIEIVEKYDEEMEKLFYENRKKRREANGEPSEKTEKDRKLDELQHMSMMQRLAELEIIESINSDRRSQQSESTEQEVPTPQPFELPIDEVIPMEEMEEEETSDSEDIAQRFGINERLLAQPGVSQKEMEALLEYLDACDEESSDEEYDEDEEDIEEKEEEKPKVVELDSDDYASDEDPEKEKKAVKKEKVIEIPESIVEEKKRGVRFAKQLEKVKTFLQSDTVEVKEEENGVPETKSILRSKEPTPVDRSALEPEQKELPTMSSTSFPGEIVEKNPYDCEPSTSKDPAPVINEGRVSKFRASRNNRN